MSKYGLCCRLLKAGATLAAGACFALLCAGTGICADAPAGEQGDERQQTSPGSIYSGVDPAAGTAGAATRQGGASERMDDAGTSGNYAPGYNGFAGTWRDPATGDIITSVIAPRNPGSQQYDAPIIIEPQVSPNGWGGGSSWGGSSGGGGVYYVSPNQSYSGLETPGGYGAPPPPPPGAGFGPGWSNRPGPGTPPPGPGFGPGQNGWPNPGWNQNNFGGMKPPPGSWQGPGWNQGPGNGPGPRPPMGQGQRPLPPGMNPPYGGGMNPAGPPWGGMRPPMPPRPDGRPTLPPYFAPGGGMPGPALPPRPPRPGAPHFHGPHNWPPHFGSGPGFHGAPHGWRGM